MPSVASHDHQHRNIRKVVDCVADERHGMRGVSSRKLNCDEKEMSPRRKAKNRGHLFVEVAVTMQAVHCGQHGCARRGYARHTAVLAFRTETSGMREIVHQSDITRMNASKPNSFRFGEVHSNLLATLDILAQNRTPK